MKVYKLLVKKTASAMLAVKGRNVEEAMRETLIEATEGRLDILYDDAGFSILDTEEGFEMDEGDL